MHLLTLAISSLLVALPAGAQSVPSLMNYQGRLTEESGQPLTNGTYAVQFRLWNRAITNQPGETLVWGRQYDLTIINGVFNVILGAPGGIPLPGAAVNDLQFAFGDAERYLGLTLVRLHGGTVISESQRREILPRQQLLSVPYTIQAAQADLARDLAQAARDTLVPPGTIIASMGISATPPDGWEFCRGQEVSRSDPKFARLYAAIRETGGAGNGLTTFNIPDLRGLFLRGVDAGAGRDPEARAVGSSQPDAFQGHYHLVSEPAQTGGTPRIGTAAFNGSPGTHIEVPQGTAYRIISDGVNGVPRISSETRPKNVSVHYLIKL
jgi:hypothetical protein